MLATHVPSPGDEVASALVLLTHLGVRTRFCTGFRRLRVGIASAATKAHEVTASQAIGKATKRRRVARIRLLA